MAGSKKPQYPNKILEEQLCRQSIFLLKNKIRSCFTTAPDCDCDYLTLHAAQKRSKNFLSSENLLCSLYFLYTFATSLPCEAEICFLSSFSLSPASGKYFSLYFKLHLPPALFQAHRHLSIPLLQLFLRLFAILKRGYMQLCNGRVRQSLPLLKYHTLHVHFW